MLIILLNYLSATEKVKLPYVTVKGALPWRWLVYWMIHLKLSQYSIYTILDCDYLADGFGIHLFNLWEGFAIMTISG